MADFVFRISPNIILGPYVTTRLGQFARDYGTKYMVILDPLIKEVGIADKVTQSLDDRKVDYFTFDEIPEGGDTEVVQAALGLARQAHIHGIIAVGGAKAMNVGKAVCSIYNDSHDIYDYVDAGVPACAPLPLICVPTTIRDPFIFSDRTPLIDSRNMQLKLLKNQNGLVKVCLFDPNHISTLTENQIASMSIETLCIAVEAYISQKASFFSDMIIEKSLEILSYAIDGSPTLTVTTPRDVLLTQGGCMVSLASATSSLGQASLLALTINSRYNISRSLTAGILLPYVLDDVKKYKTDRLAKLSKIIRAASPDDNDEDAATAFAEYIRTHIAKANLPARLKDLGVSIEQLSLAAEDAGEQDIMNNLAKSMTADDLFDLVKRAY